MESNNEKINITNQFDWIYNLTYGDLLEMSEKQGEEGVEFKVSESINLESKLSKNDSELIKQYLIDCLAMKSHQILSSFTIKESQTSIKNGDFRDQMKIFLEAKAPTDEFYSKKKEKDPISPEEQERLNAEMRSLGLLNEKIIPPSADLPGLDGIEGLFD